MVLKVSSVKLIQGNTFSEISARNGENLMELLRENGFALTAPCGGKGLCKIEAVDRASVLTAVLSERRLGSCRRYVQDIQ